jgi:sugar O-acyltransferase (sialic acid O-acetyltransferase NeuD family)
LHQLIKALVRIGTPLHCLGFLADKDYQDSSSVDGLPVLGDATWLAGRHDIRAIIGIGATPPRRRIAEEIASADGQAITLVHPHASVGDSVTLGLGSFIGPQAVATTDIAVGAHVQLHAACAIGHDTTISDFVTIAPGATVSGRVQIGQGTFVGAGAVILPDITVGCWSIIGAGAVVTHDVEDNVTMAGVPARVIDRRPPDWQLRVR